MEIKGKIKVLNETQSIGVKGFRKREIVITTEEQYPQYILVEFIQDKCDLLDGYAIGQDVKVDINLKGREWVNPEGVAKYFNAIQGWRVELLGVREPVTVELPEVAAVSFLEDEDSNNDVPF